MFLLVELPFDDIEDLLVFLYAELIFGELEEHSVGPLLLLNLLEQLRERLLPLVDGTRRPAEYFLQLVEGIRYDGASKRPLRFYRIT